MALMFRIVAGVACLGLVVLAGCATSNPDPAAAAKAAAAQKAGRGTATTNAPFVEQNAAQSKTYPLFVPPQPATTQMTDVEKKQFQAKMAASIASNDAQAAQTTDYGAQSKEMRTIADQHSQAALKSITSNGKKGTRTRIQE